MYVCMYKGYIYIYYIYIRVCTGRSGAIHRAASCQDDAQEASGQQLNSSVKRDLDSTLLKVEKSQ